MKLRFDSFTQAISRTLKSKSDFFFKQQDPFTQLVSNNRMFGVLPLVHHFKLYFDYLSDPGITNAVNTFGDQVIGVGFYITGDDPVALQKIQKWFKKIKIKRKLKTGFRDALISGNMGLEKVIGTSKFGPDKLIDVELIDMRVVIGIEPDPEDESIPMEWIQRIRGKENRITYDNTIHFKLFEISRSFLGIGLFSSLSVPQYEQDGELRSILDDMKQMRSNFAQIINKHASPDRVFIYENESEEVISEEARKFKTRKQGEAQFTNKTYDYKELTVDPRARFDKYIDIIQLYYDLGTQTPAAKLQSTTGFTEASANAVLEIVERRIRGIQDDLKTVIEEDIINVYLEESEIDPEEANIEFHFGQPDIPDFDINVVFKGFETKDDDGNRLISFDEARQILEDSGYAQNDTDENETEEEPKNDRLPMIKIDGVKKHIIKLR